MFFGVERVDRRRPMYAGGSPARRGTYSAHMEDRRVVAADRRHQEVEHLLFGVEKSMWQRQIHFAASRPKWSIIPTGCGSWTITKSYASRRSRAFSAL